MSNTARKVCVYAIVLLYLPPQLFSQNLRTFNQNASRSNHTRLAAADHHELMLRLNGDRVTTNSDGVSSKGHFMPGASASYLMGNWGIGMEYGSFTATPAFNIEEYMKNMTGFSSGEIISSQWKTQFLLAGISWKRSLGNGLQAGADIFGGLFKMKPPAFSVKDKTDGTPIADSYHDSKTGTAAENSLFAVKPTIRLEWFPAQGAIGFHVHASYLQAFGAKEVSTYYRDLSKVRFDGASQQEIRAQVLSAPVRESHTKGPVNSIAFGAGITLKIAGHSITSPRDAASGIATGRRSMPVTGTGNATVPGGTVSNSTSESCGPVTQRFIDTDGSIEEMVFSCPADAIAYKKQTQGTSFGEKVSHPGKEQIVHRDIAARYLVTGRLEWNTTKNDGILTNETALPGQNPAELNITTALLSAREAGSGMATGRRIYRPVLDDGSGSGSGEDTLIVSMKSNPLYSSSGNSGNNPLHNRLAGIGIILTDTKTGETVASTKTDKAGDFYFANVPDGAYTVGVSGSTGLQKTYDIQVNKEADISGIVKQGTHLPILTLQTERIDDSLTEPQLRRRVEVLKSNKTGDPHANRISRSVKTYFETGDKPTADQSARPGNPIGGIIVKGGKNPGGNFFTTTTDRGGWFEMNSLKEGKYSITLIHTLYFNDGASLVLPGSGK